MVMNKLIEPELKPVSPSRDIFVLYCSHCLQLRTAESESIIFCVCIRREGTEAKKEGLFPKWWPRQCVMF